MTKWHGVPEGVKWDNAELVTIQLTLSKDDVSFLQGIVESGEDMGVGICRHIVEQYNAKRRT
jgi:hypothetical protein